MRSDILQMLRGYWAGPVVAVAGILLIASGLVAQTTGRDVLADVDLKIATSNRQQDMRILDLEKRSLEVNARQDERITRIEERQVNTQERIASLETRFYAILLAVLGAAVS